MRHNPCLIKTATNRNLRLIKTLKTKSMFDQKCNMLMHRGHTFTKVFQNDQIEKMSNLQICIIYPGSVIFVNER